jgi:acyl transferase domain-containing protein
MILLEVGPGNALASLARQTLLKDGAKRVVASMPHPREARPDAEVALEAASRLWLAGVDLDFKAMHADARAHRVPLPTYPFERKRFWVDALPAAPAKTDGPRLSTAVEDFIHAPTWTRDDSIATKTRSLEHAWLVLGEGDALGQAVARQVRAAGGTAVVVEPGTSFERVEATRFRVRPGDEGDMANVVRDVRSALGQIDGAIHLWSARPGVASGNEATAFCYHALVALAASLAPSFGGSTTHLVAATFGAESVLDEPVRVPAGAHVIGPVIALPTEMVGVQTRAVDVGSLDGANVNVNVAALQLVREAAVLDGERFTAWRAGRRWVRRTERVALPPAEPAALPIKQRGVYLITGGLGGIGLTLSRWLATTYSARLVLTTRKAPHEHNSEITRALQEIEAAGGEVEVAVAAAEDEEAMRRAVAAARARFGSIDGVIHAAGVPGTGTVALRKTPADVDAVLGPKVGGLRVLTRVLDDGPLDFVALFSSINALIGVPGVADYGSANAVLDAFAESAGAPSGWRHVVAFDWDAWRDVGMAAKLVVPEGVRKEREALLRHAIAPAAGVEAFARVLASGRRRVVVSPFDQSELLRRVRDQAIGRRQGTEAPRDESADAAPTTQARPDISSAYEAPATDIEKTLAQIWGELLGVERAGVHDDFFELGGHSLLATRVLARVDQVLGVRLTLRDIFDAPTIKRLSERLGARAPTGVPPEATDEGDREEIEF